MTGDAVNGWTWVRGRCAALHCELVVEGDRVMCPKHWSLVSIELRNKLVGLFQPGQTTGRVEPSKEWIDTLHYAVSVVKGKLRAGVKPVRLRRRA